MGSIPRASRNFRKRLIEHDKERYAFDRLLAVARTAGFLPDKVTLLTDTTWAKGAGAVQDTYTLIRKAVRPALAPDGLRPPVETARARPRGSNGCWRPYLDQDRKADLDWTDPQQRAEQLQVARPGCRGDPGLGDRARRRRRPLRSTGWLLTKILGRRLVTDAHGAPQIGRAPPRNRTLSVTDPDMRYGHKRQGLRFRRL